MEDRSFAYTYSAKEQAQIKQIREKYTQESQPDKMEQLRRLDAGVTRKGTVVSLILGILGTLVMGTGMSLVMTELGAVLGELSLIVGVAIGAVGILMVVLAYPAYMRITQRERKRIAPEILRLTDELLK